MYTAGREALAGLQLLVAVAKADSELTTDERVVIAGALEDAHLPDGITVRALIGSSSDVDALIAQVNSQHARDVAFAACLAMANANIVCRPNQQAILDKIQAAWRVPAQVRSQLGRVAEVVSETVGLPRDEPMADPRLRDMLVKAEILRHCVVATVLGRNPLLPAPIPTELARASA